ncbi:hypothetical protein PR202_gb25104 [Eleusine coracana subsp. coracana]|uniref:Uncharacterized protein n=1 Tax=Eleusine coracana subsp. coracana TaxID=191504 RepID=A0AAV5FNC3_ELECO|nr:hypothetical protein QOZ80_5BG0455510 [Eleusine coracana subsp. coracana]GJN36261.1 hypothetical protein PR202_gb25104 [Eleusine coracana subsp. coracana]
MAAPAARPPPPTMVIQDDYIDMDLTPSSTPLPPASPRFEFHRRRDDADDKEEEEAPADELFYKGKLLPLHLPPRLQLVQRLLQHEQVQQQQEGANLKRDAESLDAAPPLPEVMGDAAAGTAMAGGKAAGGKKPSWSKRLKVVKRWASRYEYIRSLFFLQQAARPSDIVVDGNGSGSVSARTHHHHHDSEPACHHRKSFSGIIRRVRLVATKAASPPAPGVSPMCSSSSSSSSSSSTPSCGNANGFFFRSAAAAVARTPVLKRSSSAGSEEGAIQGAIAHCKRSSQGTVVSAARRSSASDVVFYSVTNTPRASSVAAGEEMCRG